MLMRAGIASGCAVGLRVRVSFALAHQPLVSRTPPWAQLSPCATTLPGPRAPPPAPPFLAPRGCPAAKGGGSANKTSLYQQTKAVLNEKALAAFLEVGGGAGAVGWGGGACVTLGGLRGCTHAAVTAFQTRS